VSILLSNGDGTFQTHMDYPAGTPDVADVALGDFNRDGKLDLGVPNPSSDTVSVLLGNGDGAFRAPVAYATGNHPVAVTAADLNGDGILDFAVTNLNARTVSILLGNGDGTFQSKVDYTTTGGPQIGPAAITTGDFNDDGVRDLAITDQLDNTVSILLGNGNGTFQAPLEFSTGTLAFGVAAGDFNGDGRLDIAVGNYASGTASVLLQQNFNLPPPTDLTATVGGGGPRGGPPPAANSVILTWTQSTAPVVGYNVYRSTTSGAGYVRINPSLAVSSTYADITVQSATTYYYVVTAVGPDGVDSVFSNQAVAVIP